jgi:hypothetical protein
MGGPYVTKLSSRVLDEFDFIDGILLENQKLFFRVHQPLTFYENPFIGIRGIHSRKNTFVEGILLMT